LSIKNQNFEQLLPIVQKNNRFNYCHLSQFTAAVKSLFKDIQVFENYFKGTKYNCYI